VGEIVALTVHFLGRQSKDIERTGNDTEIAAFASLGVDDGRPFHFSHNTLNIY